MLERAALAQSLPHETGKLLALAYSLCMNDLQWGSGAATHAQPLADRQGYTPNYLHYNTGLHTSVNGRQLAALLEQLLQAWPHAFEDLTLLVHSMGGLVSRSACHVAELAGMTWRSKLKNVVFLRTPHHGAPLERVGNWIDRTLSSNLVTRPFAAIGQIRSRGITDLRYGHVLESSWLVNGEEMDRFERCPDSRQPLPLPAGVSCFTVAANTSGDASPPKDAPAGDGLVLHLTALGQHDEGPHCLYFPRENQ